MVRYPVHCETSRIISHASEMRTTLFHPPTRNIECHDSQRIHHRCKGRWFTRENHQQAVQSESTFNLEVPNQARRHPVSSRLLVGPLAIFAKLIILPAQPGNTPDVPLVYAPRTSESVFRCFQYSSDKEGLQISPCSCVGHFHPRIHGNSYCQDLTSVRDIYLLELVDHECSSGPIDIF